MWRDPATGEMRGGIKAVSYSHEALADAILANPMVTQRQLSEIFGYSEGWLSSVIASDGFQAFLAERKAEIVDPVLRGAVEESFKGLVLQSLTILRKKLETNPSDDLALEVFKSSSRALGYGARVQVGGVVQHEHKHSLIGVLSSLPPAGRVVEAEPAKEP